MGTMEKKMETTTMGFRFGAPGFRCLGLTFLGVVLPPPSNSLYQGSY